MTKRTHVYSIRFFDWPSRHIAFYRYDPRDKDKDVYRLYRRYSGASAGRFARLLGRGDEVRGGSFKNPDRMQFGRVFGPTPQEMRQVNGVNR